MPSHSILRFSRHVLGALLIIGAVTSQAAPVTYQGSLANPANTALVGSGPPPAAPAFGDDFDIANNVAVYHFNLAGASHVQFTSLGFAAGGVDPYFSLFDGAGTAGTFIGSNADQAFMTGGDFALSFALAAGDYTFALGAFANMSFAENLGTGTLADGFIGLGGPDFLGDGTYVIVLNATADGGPTPVPEPATFVLLLAALGAWSLTARRSTRRAGSPHPA